MGTDQKLPRRTDSGNAELFAADYRETLRFDYNRKRWLVWRGHWWTPDGDQTTVRLAKRAARYRLQAAVHVSSDEERSKEVKWATESESLKRITAALTLAEAEPLLGDSADWDTNPDLVGVANGVLDLRAGELRAGRREDRITMHTNIPFDPAATCPRWEQFLSEIFEGDQELISFVHRALGYSLSGHTSEQCLFLLHGDGANGKSTFVETLRAVLGDLAYNLPFSAFELRGRSPVPNDTAALPGRRFVSAAETNERTRLNEARVKALTGCDRITARLLYKEFFEFRPVAKFWLSFNHKPAVEDESHGFWRRVRLIPFPHRFDQDECDPKLSEKLQAEAPGILAWAARGFQAYLAEGLGMAAAVQAATAQYQEESDALAYFLDECCVVHPDGWATLKDMWEAYTDWAKHGDWEALDRKQFNGRMERRFEKGRQGHERTRCWFGVCLQADARELGIADKTADKDTNFTKVPIERA